MFLKRLFLILILIVAVSHQPRLALAFLGSGDDWTSGPGATTQKRKGTEGAENLPAGWEILYSEDFQGDKPEGWQLAEDDNHLIDVSWSKLRIRNKKKSDDLVEFVKLPIDPYGDYRIEVTFSFNSDNQKDGAGFFWGSDIMDYNQFSLTPGGKARLQVMRKKELRADGEFARLKEPIRFKDLNTGYSENFLAIEKKGDRVEYFANGEKLFSAPKVSLVGDAMGFRLAPQTEIKVSRLVVSQDTSPLRELSRLPYSRFVSKQKIDQALFSPDSRRLATESLIADKVTGQGAILLMFWAAEQDDPLPLDSRLYYGASSIKSQSLSFSKNGDMVVFPLKSNPAIFDLGTDGLKIKKIIENVFPAAMALSPDGQTLALHNIWIPVKAGAPAMHLNPGCELSLFDAATGKEKGKVSPPAAARGDGKCSVENITFSPDSAFFATVIRAKDFNGVLYESDTLKMVNILPSARRILLNEGMPHVLTRNVGDIESFDQYGKLSGGTKASLLGLDHNGILAGGPDETVMAVSSFGRYGIYLLSGDDVLQLQQNSLADSKALTAIYDQQRSKWVVAADNRFARLESLPDTQIRAIQLYAEAKELINNGFERPAGIKMLEAFALYPAVKNGLDLQLDLFFYKTPLLSLAGQVSLRQYRALMGGKWVPRLGVVVGDGGEQMKVRVSRIFPGSSMDKAGVKKDDLILSVAGKDLKNKAEYDELLQSLTIGAPVRVTIERNGSRQEMTVPVENMLEKDGGSAVFALFLYGNAAARAGHPDLTEWAAAEIRRLGTDYPSAFFTNIISFYATGLEGLAMAAKGLANDAYDHILLNGGLFDEGFTLVRDSILDYGDMWAPLYADRKKLAYLLKREEKDLAKPSGQWPLAVSFPRSDGTMIEVSSTPPTATSLQQRKPVNGAIVLE